MSEKTEVAKREEATLHFWNERKIFEKSLNKEAPKGEYVFYDGPPFATGTPHYGHIVASVIKDAMPRYWTMRGYRVPRQWGWDCHGLPIENIVEKELGFKHKKDIVAYGITKFNEQCRSKVLMYVDEWKKVIPRVGRWADMENPYFTMSRDFMESVWWVFKQLYDKGLVYEDYRSMHICPRCETTLSQSEVTEGYKDVKDLAVTVKFRVKNPGELGTSKDHSVYILAWTTTPWTLPGNVALAIGNGVEYVMWTDAEAKVGTASYIASANWFNKQGIQSGAVPVPVGTLKKLQYEPSFDYYASDATLKNRENGWKVYAADFVTADNGTGIAHEAPAFGADDWELAKKYNLPFIQHVNFDGTFKSEVKDFAGEDLSPRAKNIPEEVREVDLDIIKYLEAKSLLFAKEKYLHSYPHCWRCDTPLLNYATSSWFVKIEAQKDKLLEAAKPIEWSPEHIKRGRWGKWLEGARDWSISRQRFWASVIPIWRCEKCKTVRVFGSASELEEASGKKIDDLHKHIVDEVTVKCQECDGTMKRIPDVLDTWFDSGSMPYGQAHFLGETALPHNFPAKFIAEGQDQTRAWFYYLHVMATSIFDTAAFENVIVNGVGLAEDGKKMSKRLQNYPDPMEIVEKYGADALRLYLLSSPVVQAENLNFSEKGVNEWKSVLTRIENVLAFYHLYKNNVAHEPSDKSEHALDRWIIARLNQVHGDVTGAMNEYNLTTATRSLSVFINDLSKWYLRRSRERIKGGEENAFATLLFVLREFSKLIAPFAPFMAEHVWQGLKYPSDPESVHLTEWGEIRAYMKEELQPMDQARIAVEHILMAREYRHIPVRQPLSEVALNADFRLTQELVGIVKEETNIKEISFHEDINEIRKLKENSDWYLFDDFGTLQLAINTRITPELEKEALLREAKRAIQAERHEKKLEPQQSVRSFILTISTTDDLGVEDLAKLKNETKVENIEIKKDPTFPKGSVLGKIE